MPHLARILPPRSTMSRQLALIFIITMLVVGARSNVLAGPIKVNVNSASNGNVNNPGNGHNPTTPISCTAPSCVDLSTNDSSGTANGALFSQIDPQPTGHRESGQV